MVPSSRMDLEFSNPNLNSNEVQTSSTKTQAWACHEFSSLITPFVSYKWTRTAFCMFKLADKQAENYLKRSNSFREFYQISKALMTIRMNRLPIASAYNDDRSPTMIGLQPNLNIRKLLKEFNFAETEINNSRARSEDDNRRFHLK